LPLPLGAVGLHGLQEVFGDGVDLVADAAPGLLHDVELFLVAGHPVERGAQELDVLDQPAEPHAGQTGDRVTEEVHHAGGAEAEVEQALRPVAVGRFCRCVPEVLRHPGAFERRGPFVDLLLGFRHQRILSQGGCLPSSP
jgi:hypothetical protein